MVDEEKQDELDGDSEQTPPSGKKKMLFLGGGALAVPALAYALALMAVPKPTALKLFNGPFVRPLTESQVQVNLGDEKDRFFVFEHNVVYESYNELYFEERMADPLYQAFLKDALIGLAASKTPEQVYEVAYEPSFREEVKLVVDPLLFPVHIGNGARVIDRDPSSGLARGSSIMRSTFRGPFYEHSVHIDDTQRTISIDDGPQVKYEGHEADLELYTENQELVYVDVRGIVRDFQGDVRVGVKGRVLSILKLDALLQ